MIRLTRINECPFYLNSDLIEFIEATPDTVITMVNGGKVLAKEPPEEIVKRVVEFRRRIGAGAGMEAVPARPLAAMPE